MSIFSQLHQLTQNTDALVELAENKDKALQGASDEDIRAAVEEVVASKDFITRDEALSEENVTTLIEAYGRDGVTEEEVLALIDTRATGGGLTEEEVVSLIEERSVEGGLSEEDVLLLIDQNSRGDGLTEEDVLELIRGNAPETDLTAIREELQETRTRLDELLDDLNKELSSRIVGPPTPLGDRHTYAGWGIHFTTKEPLHFGKATIRAFTSGTVNVELFKYQSGNVGELVDSTTVQIPVSGVQEIDLDIDVPEEGQYLLTRDWETQPSDNVSLWRMLNYTGWENDSDESITFHGAGHDEFSSNKHWYYFFNLHVEAL